MSEVVLVSGASSGIGEALVQLLLQKGYRVAGLARTMDVNSSSSGFLPIRCDVADPAQVQSAVQFVLKSWGQIDCVIANAGFGVVGDIADLKPQDFARQLDVNFYGVLYLLQATLGELRKRRGRIGIVGSVNSYVALPGASAYAVSKFMVRALADALRLEEREHGVSVTFLAPGFIDTGFRRVSNSNIKVEKAPDPIPLWIQMSSPQCAKVIWRAVQWRRREVVITGHGKFAVWMERHFPATLRFLIGALKIRARAQPQKVLQ
jgi:NAD(P)-dependent dehydrogenase (short-subunit alcohol dehydrogenase family)